MAAFAEMPPAELDGFNLQAAVRIEAEDDDGRERLVRDCARPCFALDRLSVLPDGRVEGRRQKATADAASALEQGRKPKKAADDNFKELEKAAKALYERMIAAREANRKAQALAVYSDEQEPLANHAVMGHLNATCNDFSHMAQRDPQLATRYEKVLAVSVQRGEASAAGIARAKASKAEPKKG